QRQCTFLVGAGDPDDVDARRLGQSHLGDRGGDIGGQRVRHGLHGDRSAVAHRDFADVTPTGFAADDVLVRAIAHADLLPGVRNAGDSVVAGPLGPSDHAYYGAIKDDPLLPRAAR